MTDSTGSAGVDETSGLLRGAWSALGGDSALLDRVGLTGYGQGLLPSSLHALPAMVAAVSTSTLAASVLDSARRGDAICPVSVDVEHVAAAARSERYARMEGAPEVGLFAPLSRFWRTSDGWLRLHANYPWHRERALQVLRCDDQVESVRAAVADWRGEELENALASAGGVGSAVRSRSEWLAHAQGRAVAAAPLLEPAAVAGTGRRTGRGRAAGGYRILDLTRVIAGPVATRTLAAWGADVLRLDSPALPEIPTQAVDTLMGKRSSLLDVARSPGRTRLEELLAEADLLVQGYRPGALAQHGLAPDDLAERHPHLSVVTLSAWGASGPWATRRGFDSLVQCASGIAAAEGSADEPGVLPAQALDHATGYLAAAASMLALAAVERGEPSRSVNLSLAQTAGWLMDAGTAVRQRDRDIHADRHLVTLLGAAAPVHVVAPPGRVGELRPRWSWTTSLGADPAAFASAPA